MEHEYAVAKAIRQDIIDTRTEIKDLKVKIILSEQGSVSMLGKPGRSELCVPSC